MCIVPDDFLRVSAKTKFFSFFGRHNTVESTYNFLSLKLVKVREHNLPDSKVDAGHLNAEENSSYGSTKAAGHSWGEKT